MAEKDVTPTKTGMKTEKIVKDPVHGDIKLHPLCVAIIDTPPFQRLRDIKQLGGAPYVYPGGSHSRFEHSLGVCHLAGRLIETLKEKQPELKIRKKEVLCVKIAGLCHDLGHGPFSHAFDMRFIPKVRPTLHWKHENASCQMFDHVVKKYVDIKELTKYKLGEEEQKMIKKLIKGKIEDADRDRAFLYQIVNNNENGVDVDKWDYFLRDCHHVGIGTDFDIGRLIEASRVIRLVDGKRQICWRDKEMFNVHQMFITRYTLHRRVYQHKVIKAVEMMIVEAMEKADVPLELSTTVTDDDLEAVSKMEAYSKLTDSVFYQIKNSDNEQLKDARELLLDVEKRKLYRCVAESPLIKAVQKPREIIQMEEALREDIIEKLKKEKKTLLESIRVLVTTFDLGIQKDKSIYQYTKKDKDKALPVDHKKVSLLSFPSELFSEVVIRVYLVPPKDDKADKDVAKEIDKADEDFAKEIDEDFAKEINKALQEWGKPDWEDKVKELITRAEERKAQMMKRDQEQRKADTQDFGQ